MWEIIILGKVFYKILFCRVLLCAFISVISMVGRSRCSLESWHEVVSHHSKRWWWWYRGGEVAVMMMTIMEKVLNSLWNYVPHITSTAAFYLRTLVLSNFLGAPSVWLGDLPYYVVCVLSPPRLLLLSQSPCLHVWWLDAEGHHYYGTAARES